jgi:hypothetical protein
MIRKLAVFVLFLLNTPLFSQNMAASPYSSSGLGERIFQGTQATRHMGGLDVFTDSIHANLNNPASYGYLKFTTYSVGVNYTNNNLASSVESQNSDVASLDYLAVSIPTKKFSFGFGIVPYSAIGYRLEGLTQISEKSIFNRYEGSGGLNQTYFSLGVPLTKYFAVGATLNYNFGTLFYRSGQYLEGIDNGTFVANESSVNGLNYQLSAQVKIPIKRKYAAQAMFSYQPESLLESQNSRVFYIQSLTKQTIADFTEIDLAASGLDQTNLNQSQTTKTGLGFGKNQNWFVGVQYNFIKSANFNNVFFERKNITYQDAKKWIVGGFFIPDYTSFTSFWSRVVYRFGFRTEQMSTVVNNIPLTETGISFGVGLPLAGLSNANIGLEISKRGQKNAGLVQETILALRVGLSLNDIWFIKRKYN